MSKVTFKKIDNGYRCKPSYECSNGLIIEMGDKEYEQDWKYYVNDIGFDYLKDAKEYCATGTVTDKQNTSLYF